MPTDAAATQPSAAILQPAPATAQPDPEAKQRLRGLYVQAFRLLRSGAGRDHAQGELQKQGLDAQTAGQVVGNVDTFIAQLRAAYRQNGLKNIGIGILVCIIGIVVTALTYGVASSGRGGGHYIIAWGAVLFGAIQALRGLFRCAQQPSEADLVRAFNLN